MATDIEALIDELTLEEKVALVGGQDQWQARPVERLGIPALRVTDGPNGARGQALFGQGSPTVCVPCGSALGATWDPELLERVGAALGQQARSKGAHVLLAPTVNLHRHPLAGRTFECYSEDPLLAGALAVGFVRGCQREGVGTTTKHFAGNESEFQRMTINSVVAERALRELYLVPFEAVVRDAGAWGIMAAYNRLNGPYCTESRWLLTDVLRDEWGFDGFVISDWYATHAAAEAANAGLDMEMPGPAVWFDAKLVDAVEAGDVDRHQIDEMVRRMLRVAERTGVLDGKGGGEEQVADLAEHRALCRDAAVGSITLLKNDDDVLPLDVDALGSVAVIGPNADRACIMGGGSANVNPHYSVSPLEAIRRRMGPHVDVRHESGGATWKYVPALGPQVTTADGSPGALVEYFSTDDLSGEPVRSEIAPTTRFRWLGTMPQGIDGPTFSMRMSMRLRSDRDATVILGLVVLGQARVLVDGSTVLDGWDQRLPRGEALFGMASEEIRAEIRVQAATPVEIVVEFTNRANPGFGACMVGGDTVDDGTVFDRAVDAASGADAAIVVVGTDGEWETEGNDRADLDLPGRQAELVERVGAVNDRTVVVLNAGAPVDTRWSGSVPAVLVSWFGGQEMADAIVDVLTGERDPGGRLPITFPQSLDDVPCRFDYPGEDGEVRYSDGVFAGYRGYDARRTEPAWCFGHGLSYTSLEIGSPELSTGEVDDHENLAVDVTVPVTNIGERAGSEVVQLYVSPPSGRLLRPPIELKAFAKVHLDPGRTTAVTLSLNRRAFAAWSPKRHAWVVDPGDYELRIGRSSRRIDHTMSVTVRPGPS